MKSIFGLLMVFLLLGVFAPKFKGWVRFLLIAVIVTIVVYSSLT